MATPQAQDVLQELIDEPNETLEAEYKTWLDLNDNEVRADLARHIAALANHGGGTIILGFADDMRSAGPSPFATPVVDRDLVSAIVKKYLEPTFHCDVRVLRKGGGAEHPIIIVPPHAAVPICTKASGPLVDGKSRGIAQGVYYIRKPGPESAPILSTAEWAPLIRRCVMHERSAILAGVNAALRGENVVAPTDRLRIWHDATHSAFVRSLRARSQAPKDLEGRYWIFSYAIDREDGQIFDIDRLINILGEVNREATEQVKTGWSMFHIFNTHDLEPFSNTDPESGAEDDFLECNMLRDDRSARFPGYDFWRAAPSGLGTLVRPYWEDDPYWNEKWRRAAGSSLSPFLLARCLAEFVMNARGVANRFEFPTHLTFRCEWRGLKGRELWDQGRNWTSGHVSQTNDRTSTLTVPIASLADGWSQAVVKLASPVLRAFRLDRIVDVGRVIQWSEEWKRW
jgi:hypothetical protein